MLGFRLFIKKRFKNPLSAIRIKKNNKPKVVT